MSNYLFTWGSNDNSKLNIPDPLSAISSGVKSGALNTNNVYLGLRHGIIRNNDGLFEGWGNNVFGQLNFNPLINFTKPDLGIDTTYFIERSLGTIHGYGYDLIFTDVANHTGQIVNWAYADYFNDGDLPHSVYFYPKNFDSVKAGSGYVLGLTRSGSITGWGDSGNPVISGTNWKQINDIGFITGVAAGYSHALVLFKNGIISGWGDNSLSQLNFDKNYLFSGKKISSKSNHSMAMGLRSPISTGITTNINNWIIDYSQTGENITGVSVDISEDKVNWTGIYNQYPDTNTQLIVPTNLTGNKNYYVRLRESTDTFCINTGWQEKIRSIEFVDISMSKDGRYQTAIGRTGGQGFPYLSQDYGQTWIRNASYPKNWSAIAISESGQYQSAVTTSDRIYISQDYGNNWTGKESNRLWADISVSYDAKCQTAVVSNGFIYISHDSGNSWSGVLTGSSQNWKSVNMSENGLYQSAVIDSSNGIIYNSFNSGLTWAASNSPTGNWRNIAISKDGKIQAAILTNGVVYNSLDYGVSWSLKFGITGGRGISISEDGRYQTAVGPNNINSENVIAISNNSGDSWSTIQFNKSILQVALSANGENQSLIVNAPSNVAAVYTNCNFGKIAEPNFFLEKTGSMVKFNPTGKFNYEDDYYLYCFGGENLQTLASIPNELINEPVIDIYASYNNNLTLTKNKIPFPIYSFPQEVSEFDKQDSIIVTGAGVSELNQIYNFVGYLDSKPFYRYFINQSENSPSDISLFWSNNEWAIWGTTSFGYNKYYFSKEEVLFPWLVSQWTASSNEFNPPPTVKNLKIFLQPVIPPCSGFIYDS